MGAFGAGRSVIGEANRADHAVSLRWVLYLLSKAMLCDLEERCLARMTGADNKRQEASLVRRADTNQTIAHCPLYSLTALRCSPTAAKWVEIWGYVRLSADNLGISSLGTCSQFYGVLYQVQCARCHSSAQEARAPGAGTSFQDRA